MQTLSLRNSIIIAGLAIGLGHPSAQASTLPAAFAGYSISAGGEVINTLTGGGSTQLFQSVTSPDGAAVATASASSAPSVTVTGEVSDPLSGHASGTGNLTYYMEVEPFPSTGDPFTAIPVHILGGFSVSSAASGNSASVLVQTTDGASVAYTHTFSGTGPYSDNIILTADVVYEVDLSASVYTTFGSASSSIDPMFTIDPTFAGANDFQILFSDGISNDASATPLPAALPLFATGLGAMGLFGRRRKRRNGFAITVFLLPPDAMGAAFGGH